MNAIVSALPGRIRVREPALRAPRTNQRLQTLITNFAGVVAVEGNARTGSLLLRYDTAKVARQTIEAQVEAAVAAESPPRNGAAADDPPRSSLLQTVTAKLVEPKKSDRRAVTRSPEPGRQADRRGPPHSRRALVRRLNGYAKIGMLASLGASLALAAAGSKRLHAATGGVYLALLGIHMAVHRHHLLK